jgi:gliding motility-associated-like protein
MRVFTFLTILIILGVADSLYALGINSVSTFPSASTEDDMIELTIIGEFLNGCGYIVSEDVIVIGNTVNVQIIAGSTGGPCTLGLVPWQGIFQLGNLPAGVYQLNFSQSVGLNLAGIQQPISFTVSPGQIPASISIGSLPAQVLPGAALQIPITTTGAYQSQTVFLAQISDVSGSFTNAVNIGSCAGANCTSIAATIPNNLPTGTYYIRVVSSAPSVVSQVVTIVVQGSSCPTPTVDYINPTDSTASFSFSFGNWVPHPDDEIFLSYRVYNSGTAFIPATVEKSEGRAAAISGLVACTTYEYFLFQTCNSQSISSNSAADTFSTKGCTMISCLAPVLTFNAQNNVLNLQASAGMTCDGWYSIRYRRKGTQNWQVAQSLSGNCQTNTLPASTLNIQPWLDDCTEYEIQVQGGCTASPNFGFTSQILNIQTQGCSGCPTTLDSIYCMQWLRDTIELYEVNWGAQCNPPSGGIKARTIITSYGTFIGIGQFSLFWPPPTERYYTCSGQFIGSCYDPQIQGSCPVQILNPISSQIIWACDDEIPLCNACFPTRDSILCTPWLVDTINASNFCNTSPLFSGIYSVTFGSESFIELRTGFGFSNGISKYFTCDGVLKQIISGGVSGILYSPDPPLFTNFDLRNLTLVHACQDPEPACFCPTTYSAIDTTICPGAVVQVNGQTFSTQGNFAITLQNTAGCDSIITLRLNISPSLNVTIVGDTTLCPSQNSTTLQLNNLPTGATIMWLNLTGNIIGTGTSILVQNAGTYSVAVSANGCTGKDTIEIKAGPLPIVNIIGTTGILCPNSMDTIIATSAANSTYLWSTGATTSAIQVAATNQSYTVIVTDGIGCTATASQSIAVHSLPTLSFTYDSIVCVNQPAMATATLTPAQSQANFTWTGAASASGSTLSVMPSQPINTYHLTIRDDNQCVQRDSVIIRTGELQVSLGDSIQSLCATGSLALQVTTPNATVMWRNLTTQTAAGNTPKLNITSPGYYQAIVSQSVCLDTVIVRVTGNALSAPAAITNSDCFNPTGAITLAPSLGKVPFTATWAGGATGLERNTLTSGTYTVTVSDADGCTLVVQPVVSNLPVQPQQMAEIVGSNQTLLTCFDSISFIGNLPSGANGRWTASLGQLDIIAPNQAQTRIENLSPGVSSAYWTLSTMSCPNYSTDSIRVLYEYSVPMLENDTIRHVEGNPIVLYQKNNDIFPPSSGKFLIEIVQEPIGQFGDYQLTDSLFRFTTFDISTDTVLASYRVCSEVCQQQCDTAEMVLIYYKLPLGDGGDNVITPNGDSKNDGLYFDYLESTLFPDNQLYIYNRWGSLIYQESPYANGTWNGKSKNGEQLPAGTYYFVLRLEKDESRTVFGNVLILR